MLVDLRETGEWNRGIVRVNAILLHIFFFFFFRERDERDCSFLCVSGKKKNVRSFGIVVEN